MEFLELTYVDNSGQAFVSEPHGMIRAQLYLGVSA